MGLDVKTQPILEGRLRILSEEANCLLRLKAMGCSPSALRAKIISDSIGVDDLVSRAFSEPRPSRSLRSAIALFKAP